VKKTIISTKSGEIYMNIQSIICQALGAPLFTLPLPSALYSVTNNKYTHPSLVLHWTGASSLKTVYSIKKSL